MGKSSTFYKMSDGCGWILAKTEINGLKQVLASEVSIAMDEHEEKWYRVIYKVSMHDDN